MVSLKFEQFKGQLTVVVHVHVLCSRLTTEYKTGVIMRHTDKI